MIDRKVFADKMQDLSLAYNRKDLKETKVIDTWYKFLNKFDDDVFIHSVDKHITSNRNPPAISELISGCKNSKHLKEQGITFNKE